LVSNYRNRLDILDLERLQDLETWMKTNKIKLTQVNGQRKYGGPPEGWKGPPPGAHCEVFISQIPRDTYEDRLIPLFSCVGPLWEFRLMMNFSGQNRGFAYAKFGSPAVATSAISLLHGHLLEPGFRLSVCLSTEKRHLCMSDLPVTTKRRDLLQVLRVLTDGVEELSLMKMPGIDGVFAIIAFSCHRAASMAKRMLVEAIKKKFGYTVSVDWRSVFKPYPDVRLPLQYPSKGPLQPTLKLPCHINSPQRSALPLYIPSGFCRAVGGPTASQLHAAFPNTSSPSQGHLIPKAFASPMMVLRKICQSAGFGYPFCELYFNRAGPDGFLYFTYKMCIPGIISEFEGMITILPGPTANTTLEEARQVAAQQVLKKVYQTQLIH
uniref:RRM domain-containing protein n=1 Tax=Mola mola TaxID=94237 RepID=A0A3Q4BQ43_MOLML